MTHVLVKHKVNDYTNWKTEFDNFVEFRRSSGEKNYRILRPSEDPNDLTLLFEWDTQANAEKFMTSPELKLAMERAGVTEEPTIRFLNQIDMGKP
jgi:hypothetical protein